MVRFEWDEAKNKNNIRKHGFDFAEAWEIFELPVLAAADPTAAAEHRFIGIGFLRERVVVVVFSELNEGTIRIISLRKALKHERTQFEEFLKNELGTD